MGGKEETILCDAILSSVDVLDKKSREKAVGLFTSLARDKAPSTYLVSGLKYLMSVEHLYDHPGTFQQHFLDKGYKIGTARRQSSQVYLLFDLLKISKRDAGRVFFNPKSLIAKKILEVVAP